jgi:signal transduction histidine kinase
MNKLRHQLMLSYLPLILVPVLVVGLVTRNAAEQGLTLLVTQGAQRQARILAQCFAKYYEQHNSWDGVASLWQTSAQTIQIPSQPDKSIVLPSGPIFDANMNCYLLPDDKGVQASPFVSPWTDQRSTDKDPVPPQKFSIRDFWASLAFSGNNGAIVITDMKGMVIGSSDERNLGQALSLNVLTHGAPIIVNDQPVGILVVGAAFDFLDAQQQQLLNTVNFSLILSGALSIVLAVGLGLWFSWQMTAPMQQLTEGVKRLSTGEWSVPLRVRSRNEFGKLTQAFNAMANEVIRQQQLGRQMVADIAHDLRTPLSAMSLEVEAIEAGFQTPEEATTSLREEITWLQRLVDDLRTLSLMDADQIQLQVDQIPLKPFLNGLVDFWQTMAVEEGRTLTLDMPENLSVGWIDPNRIRQVLGNLIDNAIRHTKSGGHITISAKTDTEQTTIWVSDDGEGITEADLPYIFDRFYRGDRARGHGNNGSGLGLSISRRLVEMHGGTIQVRSLVGQGTTFTIRIKHGISPQPVAGLRLVEGKPTAQPA